MSNTEEGENILSHPDVQEVFDMVFSTLIVESDRGAALIGAEIVSDHLTELFRKKASSAASNAVLDRLLEYPGALSSFSAKTDVALAFGFLSKSTHQSINVLRKVRNDAAHSQGDFTLLDHQDRLVEILQLGPGIKQFITETAVRVISVDAVEKAWKVNEEFDEEEGGPLYDSKEEMVNSLRNNPDLMESLNQKVPKLQLGIAVALICGVIVCSRERESEK